MHYNNLYSLLLILALVPELRSETYSDACSIHFVPRIPRQVSALHVGAFRAYWDPRIPREEGDHRPSERLPYITAGPMSVVSHSGSSSKLCDNAAARRRFTRPSPRRSVCNISGQSEMPISRMTRCRVSLQKTAPWLHAYRRRNDLHCSRRIFIVAIGFVVHFDTSNNVDRPNACCVRSTQNSWRHRRCIRALRTKGCGTSRETHCSASPILIPTKSAADERIRSNASTLTKYSRR